MDCRAIRTALAETPAERPQALAEHLDACADCRSFAAQLAATEALLVGLTAPAPPDGLRARVLGALDARQRSRRAWWQPVAGLAAAAAVVGLVAWPRGGAPTAAPGDLHPTSYLGQHTLVATADPLADAAGLNALGVLALRAGEGER